MLGTRFDSDSRLLPRNALLRSRLVDWSLTIALIVATAVASWCIRVWLPIGTKLSLDVRAIVLPAAVYRSRSLRAGVVNRVLVEPGDLVRVGDTLAFVSRTPESNRLASTAALTNRARRNVFSSYDLRSRTDSHATASAIIAQHDGVVIADVGHVIVGDAVAENDAVITLASPDGWRIWVSSAAPELSTSAGGSHIIEFKKAASDGSVVCEIATRGEVVLRYQDGIEKTSGHAKVYGYEASIDRTCAIRLQKAARISRGVVAQAKVHFNVRGSARWSRWLRSALSLAEK